MCLPANKPPGCRVFNPAGETSEVDKESKCAFTNVMNALFKCVQLSSTCQAVTVYANGELVAGPVFMYAGQGGPVQPGSCVRQARYCQGQSTCCPAPCNHAGTNGCFGKPLAVLKSTVPTNMNTFSSSDVYTLALTNAQPTLVRRLGGGCCKRADGWMLAGAACNHCAEQPALCLPCACLQSSGPAAFCSAVCDPPTPSGPAAPAAHPLHVC